MATMKRKWDEQTSSTFHSLIKSKTIKIGDDMELPEDMMIRKDQISHSYIRSDSERISSSSSDQETSISLNENEFITM